MTQANAPQSKIGVKGQVTLPVKMRRALQLKAEDKVSFELKDGEIVVRPAREKRSFAALEGLFRRGKGKSKEEIDDFIRTMRGDL
jgi:AbrB family looped-hinge helix DNA binding protein